MELGLGRCHLTETYYSFFSPHFRSYQVMSFCQIPCKYNTLVQMGIQQGIKSAGKAIYTTQEKIEVRRNIYVEFLVLNSVLLSPFLASNKSESIRLIITEIHITGKNFYTTSLTQEGPQQFSGTNIFMSALQAGCAESPTGAYIFVSSKRL